MPAFKGIIGTINVVSFFTEFIEIMKSLISIVFSHQFVQENDVLANIHPEIGIGL